MALPVPYDCPMVPIIQCDVHNPPVVPNIPNLPEHMRHVVPLVAGYIINEACLKASMSTVRMFCYNLLVYNYWNNADFNEVVKETVDLVALNLNKKLYRTPEQGVPDAVNQILTYWTGNLVYRYPELKSVCDQQVLKAAWENSTTYNNLKQEIATMHNNQQYPQNPGMYPVQQGQYPQNPGQFPQAPMQPPVQQWFPHQPGYQNPNMYPPQQVPYPQQYPPQPPFQQQSMYPPQPIQAPSAWVAQANVFSGANTDPTLEMEQTIKQDRFQSRTLSTAAPIQVVQQPQVILQPVIEAPVISEHTYLRLDKETEMERAKHKIEYFGGAYHTDTVIRNEKFIEAAANTMVRSAGIEEEEKEWLKSYLHPTLLVEPYICSAITTGLLKKVASDCAIVRIFAIVCNPILSTVDFKPYLKALKDADSFSSLCVKMESIATALETREDEKVQTDEIITVMSQIDIMLTNLINEFLHHNLKLGMSIESFVEDAGQLSEYLLNNYGQIYKEAFDRYEQEVMVSVFENLSEETEFAIAEDIQVPKEVNMVLLPINHSITYLNLTNKELGYQTGSNSVIVDKDVCPYLHLVIESLHRDKKFIGVPSLVHLLITSDNVRYRLYKNYLTGHEYLIRKLVD